MGREAELKAALEGFNIRRGMVEEAKRIREEKVAELASKEAVLTQQQETKELKEQEKEAAEGPEKEALEFYRKVEEEERRKKEESEAASRDAEAGEYFAILDTDADGLVTLEELRARSGLDTNKDGEVSEDEAKFFLSDQEHFTLDSFKTTGFVLLKPYLDLEMGQKNEVAEEEPKEEIDNLEDEGATPEVDWHPMMTPEPPAADPNAPDHPMMTTAPPTYDEDEDYPDEEDKEEDEEEDYDINDHEEDDFTAPAEEKKEKEPTMLSTRSPNLASVSTRCTSRPP